MPSHKMDLLYTNVLFGKYSFYTKGFYGKDIDVMTSFDARYVWVSDSKLSKEA